MFRNCLKFFAKKDKQEMTLEQLLNTDIYVVHLLNTVADIVDKYVRELDSERLSLVECNYMLSVLSKIKFIAPEEGTVPVPLRRFTLPEVMENMDDVEDMVSNKNMVLELMAAAQSLCVVLQNQGVRKGEASLYSNALSQLIKIIQEKP